MGSRFRGLGLSLALAASLTLWAEEPAKGDDWPGLWGPNRDAAADGPLDLGPGMGLQEVWRHPVGKGYSEIAIVDGRGYAMFSRGEEDVLAAFDLATGKEVWRARLGATYRGHGGSDDGPISTPVVDRGRLFALNPWGKLSAFDTASGRELWSRDLPADFGAVAPYWGFATSPLVVGETLVVQSGGAERNNLVALELATGKLVWSSHPAKETGYASPILARLAGVQQIVGATTDKIFGLEPKDGSILWTHPSLGEPRQTPMVLPGDRVLLTNWDGALMLKVTAAEGAWKVEELWSKPIFKSTLSPAVYHDGHLYGMNGTYLVCVDAQSAEIKWRQKLYSATLMRVGGHLAAVGERSGNFHLIAATPEGFREEIKAAVFTPGARSLTGPMFVGKGFLLRNGEEMVLLELTTAPVKPVAPAKPAGPERAQ